jgi:hypothetical protein
MDLSEQIDVGKGKLGDALLQRFEEWMQKGAVFQKKIG